MFGSAETERLDEIAKINSEGETSSQMGRKHFHGQIIGTTLNTVTPCAASVHKVFGASNVSKLLLEVPEGQRADAANSMVYEANLRLRDPVYGCMGVISTLQQQVQSLQAELHAIRAEILKYKYREAASFISSQVSIPTNNANSQCLSQPLVLPTLAPPSPSLPPPQKVLPSQSIILSSLSSSSASSVYTPSKSTMSHGSISSENNIPYFV
ncbi:hypothetical protein P8452_43897 [Trifolium repens]|nr:hypothetical protein P8452_43897 [Trifolium repens]